MKIVLFACLTIAAVCGCETQYVETESECANPYRALIRAYGNHNHLDNNELQVVRDLIAASRKWDAEHGACVCGNEGKGEKTEF